MSKAFFVGIKGVGMTSLALTMQEAGWQITGSDSDEEFITDGILAQRGIPVSPLGNTPPADSDLVICSAAYPFPQGSFRVLSLAEALAEFISHRRVIAVAGVGGKTTTSAMLAAMFHAAGRDVGYYVGTSSIAGLPAPGHNGKDPYFIVEADEYAVSKTDKRPKFSLLTPEIVITTNIVHDHPDIYPDERATIKAFESLITSIKSGGVWICNPSDPLTQKIRADLKSKLKDIEIIAYDTQHPLYSQVIPSVFGEQNHLDAYAAILAGEFAGLTELQALGAIQAYRGAGRRQEFMGEVNGRLLFDDYGHHPGEVAATVRSFKEKFSGKRLILVFESHTYTRTEKLLGDFARAVALADLPFIMPIFESAREKGMSHSITPETFAQEVSALGKECVPLTWENAASKVAAASKPGDVILTMGAGFVYKLHKELKELLK